MRRLLTKKSSPAEPEKQEGPPLVMALRHHQQGHLKRAQAQYFKVLKKQPDNADVTDLVGMIAYQEGRYDEAEMHIRRALTLNPERAMYYNHLGHVEAARGKLEEAEKNYRKALALRPSYSAPRHNLGKILGLLGRRPEMVGLYLKGMDYASRDGRLLDNMIQRARKQCMWEQYDQLLYQLERVTREQLAQNVPCTLTPAHSLFLLTNPEDVLRVAQNFVKTRLQRHTKMQRKLGYDFKRPFPEKVRIGYVSSHFHAWTTGNRMVNLLTNHDRQLFEVFLYNTRKMPEPDENYTQTARELANAYHEIGNMPVSDAANLIYEHKIDILVDLSAYFEGSRPEIFALKPAPIQIRYADYPGTSGGTFIDYLVTDRVVVPPGQEPFFSERQIILPHTCFLSSATEVKKTIKGNTRKALGLPPKATVLCNFVQPFILEPKLFGVWMHILRQVPNAVLWLFSTSEMVEENLRYEAILHAIDPERIIFAKDCPLDELVPMLKHADIFLDSRSSARQMVVDALAAGIPVFTLYGNTMSSRLSASILDAAGLDELVAQSMPEYEHKVLQYASNAEALKQLKKQVQEHMNFSPLLQVEAHVRNFERGMLKALARLRKEQPPEDIYVGVDAPAAPGKRVW
ncbi:MAG: tetratricopeptide repeat protein [Hyphomicrobiales bacterium]|nr:tetratricopeptide repeat protein [Rickettsiales bacterium]MCP5361302.1 tetratricopeptide repeat protein [Hyphomicrobiales bacterium]